MASLEDIAASLEMDQVGALLGLIAVMAAYLYQAINDIVKGMKIIIVQNKKSHILTPRVGFFAGFDFCDCLIFVFHFTKYFVRNKLTEAATACRPPPS